MQVKILFYCPRCGSSDFRPSFSRQYRDWLLEKVGVHPHRCYICRLRFYLFKPARLRTFVTALRRPLVAAEAPPKRAVAAETSTRSVSSIPRYIS